MKTSTPASLLDSISPSAIEAMDHSCATRYNERIDKITKVATTQKKMDAARNWRLRLDLGAICYDGDPDASVVYLQANPSYEVGATRATHYQPHPDYPLSVAGPDIYAPTLDYYHNKVFRHLREEKVSLSEISQKLLKVELCPWASKKWPGVGELDQALGLFPSREPIRAFVQHLVDRGALFIIARAWDPWFRAVPALEQLVGSRVFKSRAPVSPCISRGIYPDGWEKILAAVRA